MLRAAPISLVSHEVLKHERYVTENSLESAESSESQKLTLTKIVRKGRGSPRNSKHEITEEQEAILSELPKGSASVLRRLMRQGVDKLVLTYSKQGINGFNADKHRSFHLTMEKILTGGVNRTTLRTAFIDELGWDYRSAVTECAVIWNIFPAMGLAQSTGTSLVASPNVRCNNNVIR